MIKSILLKYIDHILISLCFTAFSLSLYSVYSEKNSASLIMLVMGVFTIFLAANVMRERLAAKKSQ
jgi:hypothetical protein